MQRPERPWRIKNVQHTYVLGPNGKPEEQVTEQAIVALANLTELRYVFDTNQLRVEGLKGCTAGEVVRDEDEPDKYWMVKLSLDHPISAGSSINLRYRTSFRYSNPPPNELVQGAGASQISQVGLQVVFHPERQPRVVEWKLRDANGYAIKGEPLEIKGDRAELSWKPLMAGHRIGIEWSW